MRNKSEKFLKDYLNSYNPTGFEQEGQEVWLNYIKEYVDYVEQDNYGNVYGVIKSKDDSKEENKLIPYKVLLEAHGDEVSFVVSNITEDGLLIPMKGGGADHQIAPSKDVKIFTNDGEKIDGVFGWYAVHMRNGKNKDIKPDMDSLFIDVGATSKDEVEKMGIEIGNVVCFSDQLRILNEDKLVGRALDDKIGGFIMADIARMIKENNIKLPFDLYIANTTMEESGLRGARILAQRIEPDLAICFDVDKDTSTPKSDTRNQPKKTFGDGVIFRQAPAIQRNVMKLLRETAKENDIKFQTIPTGNHSGTNAESYHITGVPTGLVSIPLRYMHTTVEMVSKKDVESAKNLIYKLVQKIKYKHNFKYFNL